jgi:hypothetical protein
MGVKLSRHQHAVVGVEIHYSLTPPFVLPIPVVTITDEALKHAEGGKVSLLKHKHDPLGIPSLSLDQSFQQRIGRRFLSHTHTFEDVGVDTEGFFTTVLTFTPPPFSV